MYLKICEEHLLLIYLSDVSVRYVWKSIFTGETGEGEQIIVAIALKIF